MDGNSVFIALTNACSQDPNVLKPAEEKLKILETQPGFYKLLLVGLRTVVCYQQNQCLKYEYLNMSIH